jgi:hypothetical protein
MPRPLSRINTSIAIDASAYRPGDTSRQVSLLRRLAPILDPGFDPPDAVLPDDPEWQTRRPERQTNYIGSREQGFQTEYVVATQHHWGHTPGEWVSVRAYGLPPGLSLLVSIRTGMDDQGAWFGGATLIAQVPGKHVPAITALFEAEFAADRIPD